VADEVMGKKGLRSQGCPSNYFGGKRAVGLCNTWSELTPGNGHLRELAESVKRGILEAGGVPMAVPVMSLGETLMKPTAMLLRKLASMDVEESLRVNPLDGVVLMTGCGNSDDELPRRRGNARLGEAVRRPCPAGPPRRRPGPAGGQLGFGGRTRRPLNGRWP